MARTGALAVGPLVDIEPGDGGTLRDHLREILGDDDLLMAVGTGPAGPNRKPVVQVLSPSGAPVGFAKVGWNAFTRRLVANEAAALGALADRPFRRVEAPALLHRGTWRDLEIAVTSPLPRDARGFRGMGEASIAAGEVARAWETTRDPLGATEYWASVRARATEGSADAVAAIRGVEERFGHRELEVGRWHGDWAPWNLARAEDRLWALDWEHAGPAPVGLDVVHFRFQVEFLRRRRALGVASRTVTAAGPSLARLGVPKHDHSVLGLLHLVEIMLRAEEAKRLGAGVNPRVYPVVLEVLGRRLGG